jgi:hypothetical protein
MPSSPGPSSSSPQILGIDVPGSPFQPTVPYFANPAGVGGPLSATQTPWLVGTAGVVSQGASGAAVTPAYGQTPSAGDLLVLTVAVTGVATLPTTPSGWSLAVTATGTSVASAIFYKIATGADAAPTVAAITSGVISAQLSEYAGINQTTPLCATGTAAGTTSPIVVTNSRIDYSIGSLMVTAVAHLRSAGTLGSQTDTYTNATSVQTSNKATSTANHYDFSYAAATTAHASSDADSVAFTTTGITGMCVALASFNPAVDPPISSLVDPFTSSLTLGSIWATSTTGALAPVIAGGAAILTYDLSYPVMQSSAYYDLSSSAIYICMPASTSTLQQTALSLINGTQNIIFTVYENQLTYQYKVTANVFGPSIAYDPVNHLWLRIANTVGDTIVLSASPDGQTWSQIGTFAFGGALNHFEVQLQVGTVSGTPVGSCAFSHLNIITQAITVTAGDSLTGITDVATGGRHTTVSASDSLSAISDAPARTVGQLRSLTDSLTGITDTATRSAQSLTRTATDALAVVNDSPTRLESETRSLSDSLSGISDTATRSNQALIRTAADSLAGITDVATEVNEPISVLHDAFTAANGSSPNPYVWQSFGISPTVCSIQSNQLSVAIAASDTHYGGVTSQLSFSLLNSAVFVQGVSAGNQSLASLEYYPLQLFDAPVLNTLFFYINAGTLYSFVRVNTTSGGSRVTATYSPTTHAWFRIREASGTVYFETSSDGSTWSVFDSLADPFSAATMGALRVQMAAGTYANEVSSTSCAWDSVNITSAATTVTASDSVAGITDTATRSAQIFSRAGTDSLAAIGDTSSRITHESRSISDSLAGIGDVATRVAEPETRTVSDSLSAITDVATRAAEHSTRTATDTQSAVTDVATEGATARTRTATDALSAITDTATRASQAPIRTTADSLSAITDTAHRSAAALSRSVSESLLFVDDVATTAPVSRSRSATDTTSITDVATRDLQAQTRTASDSFSAISDATTLVLPLTASLKDPFTSSATLSGIWVGASNGATPTIAGGTAAVPYNASYYRMTTGKRYSLAGSSLTVQATINSSTGYETDLVLNKDATHQITMSVYGGNLGGSYNDNSGTTQYTGAVTYNPTTMAWWRIANTSGNTVAFQTSPDGSVWTTRESFSITGGMTGYTVALIAGSYSGTPTGSAVFSNLNIASTTVTVTEYLAAVTDTATRALQQILRTAVDTASAIVEAPSRLAQTLNRSAADTTASLADTTVRTTTAPRAVTDTVNALTTNVPAPTQTLHPSAHGSIALTGRANAVQQYYTSELQDPFTNSATLASLWANSTTGLGAPTFSSGVALIPYNSAYDDLYTGVVFDFSNSSLSAQMIVNPATGYQSSMMLFDGTANNQIVMTVYGGNLTWVLTQGGISTYGPTPPYDPVNHAWWRMVNSAPGTVLMQVSSNGQTWTTEFTLSGVTMDIIELYVLFQAGSYSGPYSGNLAVTNLNLTPASGVGVITVSPGMSTGIVNINAVPSGYPLLSFSGYTTALVTVPTAGTGSLSLSGFAIPVVNVSASGTSAISFAGYTTATYIGPFATSGTGSISLGGRATALLTTFASGIGSITLTGSAHPVVDVSAAGTSSMAFSGHATAVIVIPAMGIGSMALSGHATAAVYFPANGTGNLTLSGIAHAVTNITAPTATGAFSLSGLAHPVITIPSAAHGSVAFSGSANAVVVVHGPSSQGQIAFSGSATATVLTVSVSGHGALSLTGQANAVWYVPAVAKGILTLTGRATVTSIVWYVSAHGSITLSGRAIARGPEPVLFDSNGEIAEPIWAPGTLYSGWSSGRVYSDEPARLLIPSS